MLPKKLFIVPDILDPQALPVLVRADDMVDAYMKVAKDRGWPRNPPQTEHSRRQSDDCVKRGIPRPPELHPAYDFVVEVSAYFEDRMARAYGGLAK